jgi:hypothetical protein
MSHQEIIGAYEEAKRRSLSPAAVERIYGIPRGSLGNLRWKKEGPKFYKAGKRRILYMADDVEAWIHRRPIETRDSDNE